MGSPDAYDSHAQGELFLLVASSLSSAIIA